MEALGLAQATEASMQVVRVADKKQFNPAKMAKNNLFETPRMFCDVYCLEPGQEQAPHTHPGSDKVYAVLEGSGSFQVDGEARQVGAGEVVLAPAGSAHGVRNAGPGRLVMLVVMAPKP